MSMSVVDMPSCPMYIAPRRKRVKFCAEHPVTKVMEVTHKYPSNYFYSRSEVDRFRKEAREEILGSADSPVQRAFDNASSSVIIVVFLIIGLIVAAIAFLPILLLLKISFPPSQEDIDSSIQPYAPSTDLDTSSFTERLLLNLMGQPSLSCSSNGSSQYEK
mmetsp:Transcript_18310/g.39579  ORF Transcript_18310/g.39579 Transcript_18310/m.39579 type:complete len:161 (-) Transcript_18310:209-691(-)